MRNIFIFMSLLVSALHFFFMALEMYFWTKPLGLQVFHMTSEQAELSKALALNQGFYNGMLATGLLWGIFKGDSSITLFCLICVLAAGVVGAMTVSPRIFFIQSLPAAFAIALYYFMQREVVSA
jgi:putative membrane protein